MIEPGKHDDVTIGELGRRMATMENRMEAGFLSVAQSIQGLSFVHTERYEAERVASEHRLGDIEATLRWVTRAIFGAILTVVTSLIVAFFAATGGFNVP